MRKLISISAKTFRKPFERKAGKEQALSLLIQQLERGTKPVKGRKPYKLLNGDPCWNLRVASLTPDVIEWYDIKDKEGNVLGTKPVLMANIPLSDRDIIRIESDIVSLKTKIARL